MARALAPALLLLLAPALALAQVTVSESSGLTPDSGNDQVINIAECTGAVSDTFGIQFKLPTTTSVSTVDVRISDTSACPLPSTTNTAKTSTLQSFSSTSGTVSPSPSGSGLVALLGLSCTANTLQTLYVCAVGVTGTTDSSAIQTSTIRLDTAKPAAPTINDVTPGDSALEVSWTAVSGSNRYRVFATGSDGSTRNSGLINDTTTFRLGSLVNGTTYAISVVAYSAGLNASDPSAPVSASPVQVNDFWRLYKTDGGQEQGGCGTTGAGALSLLGLAALALRRRRRALPLLLALVALGGALPARAESPRWGSWDFRILPYRPNIDREPFPDLAQNTNVPQPPYQSVFGTSRKAMMRTDVGFSVYRGYGTLDLGVGVGYWQVRGYGRRSDNGAVSADLTTMRIVPTSLNATYYFDWLADRHLVPLTPYGRLSLERFNWWITNGSGSTASASGKSGYGATNGWSAAAGLAFLVDVIDPSLARDLDNDTGINHTYVFAEVNKIKVDDFGSKKSFDLSSYTGITWAFGFMFAF